MNSRSLPPPDDPDPVFAERRSEGARFSLLLTLLQAWRSPRWVLATFSLGVVIYSFAVLANVASMGDIGVRCIFGTTLKETVNPDYFQWEGPPPKVGDQLLRIGDQPILLYTDYVQALRQLRSRIHRPVTVRWEDGPKVSGRRVHEATARVRYRPIQTYIWSFVWFLQEIVIFAIGALVFWRRPRDESARLFFLLCIVTVGAYMGGYHWSEIVTDPVLIFLFAAFALFVPIVSLHFYLVFPRRNPIFARSRRSCLRAL
jgi:hypothetical protein